MVLKKPFDYTFHRKQCSKATNILKKAEAAYKGEIPQSRQRNVEESKKLLALSEASKRNRSMEEDSTNYKQTRFDLGLNSSIRNDIITCVD